MRVAPIGAYFAEAMDDVVHAAWKSAQVTHTHPEAIAGSIAVAVAAAWAWRFGQAAELPGRAKCTEKYVGLVMHLPRHQWNQSSPCWETAPAYPRRIPFPLCSGVLERVSTTTSKRFG